MWLSSNEKKKNSKKQQKKKKNNYLSLIINLKFLNILALGQWKIYTNAFNSS